MRFSVGLLLLLAAPAAALAQPREPERRFGVRENPELYQQDAPRKTLAALARALDRDRFDYIVAHLIDPAFIDEQMRLTYPTFEKLAREQVQREALSAKGYDREFMRKRIADLANQANFNHIVSRVRATFENDPDSVKALRRMASQGDFNEGAETASAKLKDVKDKTLFFKKVGDRWYFENKIQEDKP